VASSPDEADRPSERHMWLRLLLGRLVWRLFRPITLGSRCLVLDGERVLLVRHTYGSAWHLPGGAVEKGETLAEAARREVREECGLEVGNLSLLGIYYSHAEGKHDHVAIFVAHGFSGTPQGQPAEIERLEFFPLGDLPADTSPATRRRVEEYLTGKVADRW
ncbi:MAG TPA: NUDIX domain-containing protein, partial [Solirubrobacterales bacterium]